MYRKKPMLKNVAFWLMLGGLLSYIVVAQFADWKILKEVFDGLALGVAVTILYSWWPSAWRAFRAGAERGEHHLVLAVFMLWGVLLMQRIYVIVANIYDRPAWLVESALAGFIPYSVMFAGMLFLSAPNLTRGAAPNAYIWQFMFAIALGSLVAGMMIGKFLLAPLTVGW